MIPYHLRQSVKIKAELEAFSDLLHLINASQYVTAQGNEKLCLNKFLVLHHVHIIQLSIFQKMMKSSQEGKKEMSLSLNLPELLSLWQIVARSNHRTDTPAQLLINQVDKLATDYAYLINYQSPQNATTLNP